jgi:hypothetical protein
MKKAEPLTEIYSQRDYLVSKCRHVLNSGNKVKQKVYFDLLQKFDIEHRTNTQLGPNEVEVENYKGKIITQDGNVIQVIDPEKDTRFIIGLDDSKTCGHRVSYPATVQDARNYIDWITTK